MNVHSALADAGRYRRQLDRLHRKHLFSRRLYQIQQDGVSLASLSLNQAAVARLIARTVAQGEYRLGPARIRRIEVEGKARVVFAFRLTDLVVHGVVAEVLDEAMAPDLSPALYSYRKGVSWLKAVGDFARYVRAHRRSRPDPRTRGLYVLRRDVAAYTDSIPVEPRSPLWPMLRRLLGEPGGTGAPAPADWRLIESVIRPEAFVEEGVLFTPLCGVPTGQPISCSLFNVYLAACDRELDGIPGGFYARYCDDLLFAHPDPAVVRQVNRAITAGLAGLRLGLNDRKGRDLYLTGAGRPAPDGRHWRGVTTVPFLGCLVSARGTVSLGPTKRRRLLADLRERAVRTARALPGADRDRVGRTVCAVMNRTLQPDQNLAQQRSASLLRRAMTDRGELKHLDYLIARIVIEAVTGQADVRAFRAVPYETLRRDWKLVSLVDARNRWRRQRRAARS